MIWFRRHWFDLGLVVGVAALVVGAIVGFRGLQLILLLNFATLLLHQFEEYRLPGGEQWILNEVSQPKGGPADSFPLNANSAAIGNVALWIPYLVPVFFPDVIWLGLTSVLFGAVGQFTVHVVQTNIKLRTLYNPGVFTVIVGWIPLAIWYLIVAYGEGRITSWQWLFVVLYGIGMIAFFGQLLTYGILKDNTGRFPFTREEMSRFDRRRRLAHAGITPLPFATPQKGA